MRTWWRNRKLARAQGQREALAWIERHGVYAYEEARWLAIEARRRRVTAQREEERWSGLRREIGRITRRRHVDTATRYVDPED